MQPNKFRAPLVRSLVKDGRKGLRKARIWGVELQSMSGVILMLESVKLLAVQHLQATWRRRWYAIGFAWLVCLIGWMIVSSVPDYYVSSARIYMNTDEALTPLLKGIALGNDVDMRLDRLQRTLLSNTNMKRLIRLTDLDLKIRDPSDRELMVATLQKHIAVKMQTRNLFTVSYADTDPELAESVVSSLLSIFMEESAGGSRTDIDSAQRFVQSEIDRLEAQLREDERKKAEFQSRYYDLLPDVETGRSKLEQARETVEQLTSDLADAVAERDNLRKQLAATAQFEPHVPPTIPIGSSGLSDAPRTRLAQLQAQLEIAKATMTDAHPLVIALKHQIALVTAELSGLQAARKGAPPVSRVENPIYSDLTLRLSNKEVDLASLRRRLAAAGQDRDAIEDEARRAPGIEAEYLNLNRDYNLIKSNYEALLARRESAEISENADRRGDQVTIKTIDPPEVPLLPSGPNRPLYLSMALIAGIGTGTLGAFMLGQMDDSFATTTALERLGLPVLGSIRQSERPGFRRRYRLMGTKAFVSICLMLLVAYGYLVIFFAKLHPDI
jgi:polysaccharide chain length determinant protein (PEP-CTERM system associated)